MNRIEEARKEIRPLNTDTMELAQRRWNGIAKPLGSLGRLEEMVVRLAGIFETETPEIHRRAVVIMCADNGVVQEGVTQCGSEVTAAVTRNFMKGTASVNALARAAKADIFPVDIGIREEISGRGLVKRKIRCGTGNIARESAMTNAQALAAIEAGISIVATLKGQGYQLIATGEMGIGNTTTSSAVASVLLQQPVSAVTGRGAGLSAEAYQRKMDVIRQAIAVNHPDQKDALDVLAKVGGLDIAGMAGCFIGGAVSRVPVLIDGFISSVAALAAVRLAPECREFMFPSHCSKEPAGKMVLDALGLESYLNCGMFLGEGTGAVLTMPLFDAALAAYEEIATFSDTGIAAYQAFT